MASAHSVARVYWQHLRRYWGKVAVLVLTIIIAEVAEIAAPWYYKRFFDVLSGAPSNPAIGPMLVGILFIVMGIHLVSWAGWRISGFLASYLQPRIMVDLSQTSFEYLMHHSYQFFTNAFAGSLVRKVNRFSRAFADVAEILLWRIGPSAISVTSIVVILYQRKPIFAWMILGWVIIFVAMNYFLAVWKLKYDVQRHAKDSEATGALSDSITNSTNVKLFTGFEEEYSLFRKITEDMRKIHSFTWRLGETNNALQGLFMIALEFAVIFFAIRFYIAGQLTIGDFVLLQGFLLAIFGEFRNLGRVIRTLFEAFAEAQEMVDILETPYEVQDKKKAKILEVTQGKIEFQNVSFYYHQTRPVLKNFDLVIKPREKIALVGPSGAGKSTVVKLLLRFYDLDRGKLLIDGQNIANVTQDSLRNQIALVPQKPLLFHRTLMDNIRYGRREASDEEVREAAKKAHCHEFIQQLPQGYETFVGERGVKLSGGERQRVAIARAILRNAPILMLDEATSSLDSESEALIQEALHELMKDKTVIAIAHRLSTIMQMDRIVVVENGRVADAGTHESLLKKKGVYQTLWNIQAGGFVE